MRQILKQKSYTKSGRSYKSIDTFSEAAWRKYKDELRKSGTGSTVSKADFKQLMKEFYNEASGTKVQKFQRAFTAYQRSSLYTSVESRYHELSIRDVLSGGSDVRKLQRFSRDERGRFRKFDPHKFNYIGYGRDKFNDRIYSVYRYFDAYVIHLNSPVESIVLSEDEYLNSIYNLEEGQ